MVGCAVPEATSPAAGGRGAFRHELLSLILASAALVALLYLAPPTIFDSEDYVKLHAINRAYRVRSLLAGHLPLWNPHVGLGRPFLADVETAAFYPPNLLYLFLEPHLCLTLLLVGHTALLLWGWLRLGRYLGVDGPAGWMTGMAFAASGAVVGTHTQGPDSLRRRDRLAAADLRLGRPAAGRLVRAWRGRPGARSRPAGSSAAIRRSAWLTWFALAVFLAARGASRPAPAGGGARSPPDWAVWRWPWRGPWPSPRSSSCPSPSSSARATERALPSASPPAGPWNGCSGHRSSSPRGPARPSSSARASTWAPCSRSPAWRG